VVSPPPSTEETGAMGRVIESRQSKGWLLLKMDFSLNVALKLHEFETVYVDRGSDRSLPITLWVYIHMYLTKQYI
jgi:hypothetical protein